MSNLLSVAEAAESLNLTRRAVLHRIAAGTLKAQKVGAGRTSAYVIESVEVDRHKAEAQAVTR